MFCVLRTLVHTNNCCILVSIKPEAISGSSRMKGGSATKIIMETILLAGHQAAYNNEAVTLKYVFEESFPFVNIS